MSGCLTPVTVVCSLPLVTLDRVFGVLALACSSPNDAREALPVAEFIACQATVSLVLARRSKSRSGWLFFKISIALPAIYTTLLSNGCLRPACFCRSRRGSRIFRTKLRSACPEPSMNFTRQSAKFDNQSSPFINL